MSDPKTFNDFLSNLSTDTSARTDYQNDPTGTMRAAGLSESQIISVLSQDPAKIQAELGGEGTEDAVRIQVIITILVSAAKKL